MKKLLFLLIVLQFGFLFAQNTKTETSEKSLLEKYSKYISPQYEDVTKRDLRTKQYKIGENHYLAILHANPVAYYDQLGHLQDISSNIVTSTQFISAGYTYRNESNDLLFYFTQDGSRCLITDQQGTQLLKVIFTEELTGGSVILENNKIIVTGNGFEYEWIVEGTSLRIIVPKSNVYDPSLNTQPYTFEWLQKQTIINQNHINTSETIKYSLITHSIKNYEANISEIFYTGNELSKNIGEQESNLYTELNFNTLSDISASNYGYIRKTSSGSYSRTNSAMWIQNESSTGCTYGYRSFAKFSLTSIPSLSTITNTEQHMNVIALNESWTNYLNYDVYRVANNPSDASNSTLWNDIYDGTLYENDEWCSSVGNDEWSDIPAETDVQNAISSGWFALGYMVDCAENNSGFYAKFSNPYMVIDYTAPPKEIVSVQFVSSNGSNSTITEANYGTTVYLRVEAKGLNGKTVSYVANEKGISSHPNQCSKSTTFLSSGTVMWIPIGSDCLKYYYEGAIDPDPEYEIDVTIDGMKKTSNRISLRDKTLPPNVNIISPDGEEIRLGHDIIFNWDAVVDNESGLKRYDIRVATENAFNNIKWTTTVAPDKNTYTLVNNIISGYKLMEGQYFYQVRAVDNSNNGNWSANNYKTFSISETVCTKAKIKIIGVTQLAHNNNVAPGINIVVEIEKLIPSDISNIDIYFGNLDNPLFPLKFPKEMKSLGNGYYQFIIDKNVYLGSSGYFDFKPGDRIEWKIVVNFQTNDNCTSGSQITKVYSYNELTSKLNIGNGENGLVKPYITSDSTLAIENNKFFYLSVSTKNAQFSFSGASLIEIPFFNSYVLNAKTLPFSIFSLPKMQVNGLQNIEDQKITTIQFSRKSLDALVFTSADMICNIITLFSATSNQTTTVKTLMKTKAIYSWAKLISKIIKENQLEGGLSAKTEMEIIWELIKTSKDYLKNDIYKNLLISDLTAIGFSNSGDQIDEFIKIVPIINQTLAGLNMIGTIGDFYMSKETDSISISKGNGHFVNVEQVDLPGVGNSIIKNNNRIIKLKLTNQSQLKLYNVWLGFDIYAFDRSTNKYLKVENTKTPVEDPISFGGTGKIGKINFPQQSRDIEPGQSVDFISDSYSFSQSVTGHNYRADNIPYKYVFSAWSSGYPGQLNPSEAVRLSYENVSIPFYITDDIAPKVPIVSIEQVNSNGLFTFFSWKIADEDTFDIDKAQIYVDGNLWKELDARIFKSAVCPITDTIQQLKMKLTDIGGNESTFSNAIVVDVKEIDDKRPKEYSLSQNYPNPFNPTTAILYQIPVESHVTLKVYDLLGRELEVLVNEEKPAGFYDVKYNASSLSSGIYFYTIKAGDFVQTKKFILLK